MKKIKENFSNIIILFSFLLGFSSLFYGINIIKVDYKWSLKIISFSIIFLIFFFLLFILPKKIKDYIIAVLTTIYLAFLSVNLYLQNSIPSHKVSLIDIAKEKNLKLDTRSKVQVIKEMRKDNKNVFSSVHAGLFQTDIPKDEIIRNNIYPLSGISNVTTVMCNESGFFSIYKSDRFGFNNDNLIYEKKANNIMLVGDSMIHGQCVKEGDDIAGYLRKKGYNAFSFGISSNGPLTELATIREYAKFIEPKIIFWFFHPNDFYDIKREIHTPILKNYLSEDFSQNLIKKQSEIDFFVKKVLEKKTIKKNIKKKKDLTFFLKYIGSQLTLNNLRYYFNITAVSNDYDTFNKILFLAKKEAINVNAKLYFIYLPDKRELQISKNDKKIFTILDDLMIETFNFKEYLKNSDDPLQYFPWRRMIHFNKNGYELIGNVLINNFLSIEDD